MSQPAATDTQVGGDHYARLAVQPMAFAMANRWDPAAYGILKYVSRHREKNGMQDLVKAQHLIALREELYGGVHYSNSNIGISFYCDENRLPTAEATVLKALAEWIYRGTSRRRLELEVALAHLIHDAYTGVAVPVE